MAAASLPTGRRPPLRAARVSLDLRADPVLLAMPVAFGIHDLATKATSRAWATTCSTASPTAPSGRWWRIGYTLVYGIVELINFAHGEVFMIGSFVAAGFFGTLGLTAATGGVGLVVGLLLTLLVAMVASGVLNMMIERVAYRPLRNAPKLAPLITAVGFSFILQNVGLLWRGGSQQGIVDLIKSQKELFNVAGISVTNGDALAIAVTVPLVLLDDRVHRPEPAGQGDARDRAGPRGRPADGHQCRHDDLGDVHHRRDARRRGRARSTRSTRRRSGTSRASRLG